MRPITKHRKLRANNLNFTTGSLVHRMLMLDAQFPRFSSCPCHFALMSSGLQVIPAPCCSFNLNCPYCCLFCNPSCHNPRGPTGQESARLLCNSPNTCQCLDEEGLCVESCPLPKATVRYIYDCSAAKPLYIVQRCSP